MLQLITMRSSLIAGRQFLNLSKTNLRPNPLKPSTTSNDFLNSQSQRTKHVCAPIVDMKIALCEDRERLLTFIRNHFYREEPLRIGCVPIIQEPVDENFHLQNIPLGTCVMAVRPDVNDFICGAVIAAPKVPHELAAMAEGYGPNSKWGRILNIWARAEKESDVFNRFGVTRALHAYLLAVHQDYRGYGLGLRLMRELSAVGKKQKYELLTIDATSVHAACLCQNLGMKLVNTLVYRKYLDEKGYVIFTPPGPSDAIRTYALRL